MKVGLIGLGMVAQTHARAVRDASGLTLATVMARDRARVEAFADAVAAEGGHRPTGATDVAAIAADPDIDFVIVCTPPDARDALIDALATAGKPILMEKPIERTLSSATALVERCERAGVPLGIMLQHRMRESVLRLQEELGSGRLGRLGLVDIRVPWWREQSYYDEPGRGTYARDGGGVLISQAIHTLDVALQLAGPVASVQAMARTTRLHDMEAEDHVSAGLHFACGASGSLMATTAAYPGAAESIALHGERGSVTLRSEQLHYQWRDGSTECIGLDAATGGGADPMAFSHAWHQAVIEDFAAAVRDARAPGISGRSALQVHELIDALLRSSIECRTIDLEHAPVD